MNISFKVLQPLDKKSIENFMDKTVYNVARTTLDMTAGYFPRLKGDLERGSYAMGVKGGNATYGLGTTVDYGSKVWETKNVHWTNPATLPQWYRTVFKNHSELIINQAVKNAGGNL